MYINKCVSNSKMIMTKKKIYWQLKSLTLFIFFIFLYMRIHVYIFTLIYTNNNMFLLLFIVLDISFVYAEFFYFIVVLLFSRDSTTQINLSIKKKSIAKYCVFNIPYKYIQLFIFKNSLVN